MAVAVTGIRQKAIIAKAAAKYSDMLIITSDIRVMKTTVAIIDDILVGLRARIPYETVVDRKRPLLCFEDSKEGDIIVLAGKGHRDYRC